MNALQALLGIAAVCVVWLFWRRAVLDAFRQSVFTERNRLFELSLEHPDTFGFNTDAYRKMWAQCNGLIRFGFLLGFTYMLVIKLALAICKVGGRPANEVLTEVASKDLSGLPEEVRREINEIDRNLSAAVFKYLIATSPMFLMATGLVVVCRIGVLFHCITTSQFRRTVTPLRPIVDGFKKIALGEEWTEFRPVPA